MPTEQSRAGMAKTLVVDYERCCGCDYCVLICSFSHGGVVQASKSRVRMYRHEDEALYVPILCEQCEEPPCIPACPLDVISRDAETGIVSIDGVRCTGCRICLGSCPFSAIIMDPERNVAIACDTCWGDPMCAKGCMADAIRWLEAEPAVIREKRENAKMRCEALSRVLEVR